jgi:hypothetical protein
VDHCSTPKAIEKTMAWTDFIELKLLVAKEKEHHLFDLALALFSICHYPTRRSAVRSVVQGPKTLGGR